MAANPEEAALRRRSRMGAGEALLLICSVLSMIASCILWSARKQAWFDEIFTWKEASDRSLWHLYWAIQHGADGGQPLFYTTVWLWAKAFGLSSLSLRLYSCAAICLALVVTWKTLRRAYGMRATAFGVLCVWGTSGLLLDQNAEARFYGLYLLAVAVTVNIYARLAEQAKPNRRLLLCAFFSQAALVLTHILGIVYGSVILLALLVFDRRQRRFRPKVYFSYASGWLALLVWIPAIRASIAVGRPHGWILQPRLRDVFSSWGLEAGWELLIWLRQHWPRIFPAAIYHLPLLFAAIAFLVVVLRWRLRGASEDSNAKLARERGALLLAALAILTVPLVLFALSRLITPVFNVRYILPNAVGLAIIYAGFADAIAGESRFLMGKVHLAFPIVVLGLLAFPVFSATIADDFARESYLNVQRVERDVPPNTVVVAGWDEDFFRMMRFAVDPSRYFFLLDWTTALNGPLEFVPDYHLMRSYREAGYYAHNIQDQNAFLCSHRDFYVLDAAGFSWFDVTIRKMPEFTWRQVGAKGALGVGRSLFAVHRTAPLAFCGRAQAVPGS